MESPSSTIPNEVYKFVKISYPANPAIHTSLACCYVSPIKINLSPSDKYTIYFFFYFKGRLCSV